MNCGFSNNCGNNNFFCGNDCSCDTAYEDNSCACVETSCPTQSGCKGNCTVLLFIIAVIMIFCR